MRKDGEWIASLSAKLEVSRVDVAANEALDLVEVTEIDRVTGRPTSVRFFDRVEGARLRQALGVALEQLEVAAAAPARYEVRFARGQVGEQWLVWDCEMNRVAEESPRWTGFGGEAQAIELADQLNREANHPRPSVAGP